MIVSVLKNIYRSYARPRALLPRVQLSEVMSLTADVHLEETSGVDGNVSLTELRCISNLVKHYKPSTVFEIGTFDGRTTLNMALNSPAAAKIYTLDLPAAQMNATKLAVAKDDKKYIDKAKSGQRYSAASGKITQLYGDSAGFDFGPYQDSIDFIFVDGAHSYEYALNDSRIALKLLRGGKGIIVWHDYDTVYWPGVTKALNQLRSTNGFQGLKHIDGTSLVYLHAF